jgi:DMSO/TMAO reductase YedYZ heme-binding membrane subunit
MTNIQLCAIVAAIYIAPHLPTWYGVSLGVLFALASLALIFVGGKP